MTEPRHHLAWHQNPERERARIRAMMDKWSGKPKPEGKTAFERQWNKAFHGGKSESTRFKEAIEQEEQALADLGFKRVNVKLPDLNDAPRWVRSLIGWIIAHWHRF